MSDPTQQWGQSPQPAASKRSKKHLIGYPLVALVCIGVGASTGAGGAPPTATASTTTSGGELVDDASAAGAAADPATTTSNAAKAPASKADARKSGPALGDKVRDGKFEFKVTKIRRGVKRVGAEPFGEKAQGQFILVSLTVTNIGEEAQTLDGSAQIMYDAKGRKFSSDGGAAIYLDESNTFFNQINPGNTVKGVVVFDIPKGVEPVTLELHDSVFSGGIDVALV